MAVGFFFELNRRKNFYNAMYKKFTASQWLVDGGPSMLYGPVRREVHFAGLWRSGGLVLRHECL